VLWECLAGVRCYDSTDDIDLVRRVPQARVRSFDEVGVEVPPSLEAIVRRGLEADPARRFPTAGAMAQALERYHRRAHPDFSPEYLAALLNGTVPSTQITTNPGPQAERTEAAFQMPPPRGERPRAPAAPRRESPRSSGREAPRESHREETRRADDVIAELATERPKPVLPKLAEDDEEEETTARERRVKGPPKSR
jgi:serine/threonine-protein kinase